MAIRRANGPPKKLYSQKREYVQLLVIFAVISLVIVVLLAILLLTA